MRDDPWFKAFVIAFLTAITMFLWGAVDILGQILVEVSK